MKSLVVMLDRISLKIWGCYGNFDEWTPNLDQLSINSFLFDQAFATNLPEEDETGSFTVDWLKTLKENDIHSIYFGETGSSSTDWGKKNFEQFHLFENESDSPEKLAETSLHKLTSEVCNTLEELSRKKEKDWLLWLGMTGVPHPWLVPEEWFDLIGETLVSEEDSEESDAEESGQDIREQLAELFQALDENPLSLSREERELLSQLYCVYGSLIDYHLGKILRQARNHFDDDLMVVITAREGESFFHHPQNEENQNRLLSGFNESAFQIPLLVQIPECNERKQEDSRTCWTGRSRELVHPGDLVPSLLDWFEISREKSQQDFSLLPLILDGKPIPRTSLQIRGREGFQALRREDCIFYWNKNELPSVKETGLFREELFEVLEMYIRPDDVQDVVNVVTQNPERVDELIQGQFQR